jgi:DNA-binding MarR family transcriptional regulator
MTEPMTTPGNLIDSSTGHLVIRLGEAARSAMDREMRPLGGLAGRDVRVLAFARGGSLSQRDLCRLTGLDRTTMVAVTDKLEHLGLVRRERSTADRRKQVITMTAEGLRVLDEALTRLARTEASFLTPLDPDEQRQLNALLSRVFAAQDPTCESDGPKGA